MGGLPYEVQVGTSHLSAITSHLSLPRQVGRFLEARSAEIRALAGDLARWATGPLGLLIKLYTQLCWCQVYEETPHRSDKLGKLASQQVPRHMRRRAVSHNPKRFVPR